MVQSRCVANFSLGTGYRLLLLNDKVLKREFGRVAFAVRS